MEQKKCPYAKKCGGCVYQGVSYPHQLALKQEKMQQLLGSFGKVSRIIGMTDPARYRCKVQAAFGLDEKKHIISGTYRPSTHTIVPVTDCMIEDETADRIIGCIRELMPKYKLTAYDEKSDRGFLRHVLIRRGYATGEIMVVLVGTGSYFQLEKPFTEELLRFFPAITTIVLNTNDRFTSMVLGSRERVLFGSGYIEDELCGLRFRISSRSFYQVNPVQAELLYRTALKFAALSGKERVLDAYCGTGTIGLTAAASAREVVGVELNKDAVRDAISNAKRNRIRNARFIAADAGTYLEEAAARGEHFDLVIMDPPRTGSDKRFLDSLLHTAPDRIVYVSCGPDTLARDLKQLTAGGYSVQKIQPVDMFPFTEHVETVVLMSRVKEK